MLPEWLDTRKKSTGPTPRPYLISASCLYHCLKELSNRVVSWRSPGWVCDHLWHPPHSLSGRRSCWWFECGYRKQSSVSGQTACWAPNLCPSLLTAPPLPAMGSGLSLRSHWQALFSQLLFSSGLEEVQQYCLGGCSSVMPRCFRTMFWSLVAPTTTETSPEVKLWSKRRLWRNFYLICIPLFHLHTHPAQSASLLATSTCWGKKKEGE